MNLAQERKLSYLKKLIPNYAKLLKYWNCGKVTNDDQYLYVTFYNDPDNPNKYNNAVKRIPLKDIGKTVIRYKSKFKTLYAKRNKA